MKEFFTTDSDKPTPFKVNGEDYILKPPASIPGMVNLRYTELVSYGQIQSAHIFLFNECLEEESATRFLGHMDDREKPITLNTVANVANWIVETYSGNPTK